MIITCPNCEKKFKIDNSLIPEDGRDLQCGLCDHVWFYKIENENSVLKLNDDIVDEASEDQNNHEEKKQGKPPIKKTIIEKKKKVIEKTLVNDPKTINHNKTEKNQGKFFSFLIVFIISLIALVILADTLKTPLINIFPHLEVLLFNLYETLQDIKLFIIDLL
jgi:predicted Zn finger-like uncharacterized protein